MWLWSAKFNVLNHFKTIIWKYTSGYNFVKTMKMGTRNANVRNRLMRMLVYVNAHMRARTAIQG